MSLIGIFMGIIRPKYNKYDVVIVGGAIMGSSAAYFLSQNSDFQGKILVIEKDLSFEYSSTARTNSCIRQQFSEPINVQISQFAAAFITSLNENRSEPYFQTKINIDNFGYLYLANSEATAKLLNINQEMQVSLGAGTYILTPSRASKAFPYMKFSDVKLCSHNVKDEGYFDGQLLFEFFRKTAKGSGVEYIQDEVVDLKSMGNKVQKVLLKSGVNIDCGVLVNCAGPSANKISKMINSNLPVEPRKRYSFIFQAEKGFNFKVPLTIDPSGIHFRSDGQRFLAGCAPSNDFVVNEDDFSMEQNVWEEKVWPILANRVPAFESIKLTNWWVGHYAFNTFDQNAIIGPHTIVKNFFFLNGFSGHGLQQSPAMGRGISELIIYNKFKTLDLNLLGFSRLGKNEKVLEKSII